MPGAASPRPFFREDAMEVRKDGIRILKNPQKAPHAAAVFDEAKARETLRFHRSLPAYRETKLCALDALAKSLHVGGIYVKDESSRFGLKAFKGLGGSYALFRVLCERFGLDPQKTDFADLVKEPYRTMCRSIEFATATDGNHGKGVAWAAGLFGCRAHVYMPAGSAEARRCAIEEAGFEAEAVITPYNYDGAVEHAAGLAEKNGWILVQDTSWEGYEKIPSWIVQGYLTLAGEAVRQLGGIAPTHVILQVGVGAMAGGLTDYLAHAFEKPPVFILAEPDEANCLYRSLEAGDGEIRIVEGNPETEMAGLNCGTPCGVTWPVLRDETDFACALADEVTEEGMRLYAKPLSTDPKVVSGESGAVTLGLAARIARDPELRDLFGVTEDSVFLLVSTEGDTDPENYRRITTTYPL